jgi:uncharacterized membrane protein
MLVLAIAMIAFGAARRRGWGPAVRMAAVWVRARPTVLAYLRTAPATFAYLAILSVTTWVLLGSSDQVVDLLLLEHSTNLHQLLTDPVRVLIRSAFWAPGYAFLTWAVLFAVVLAPAERWLGTRRWGVVFAAGHVLATLGTALGLWVAIRYGWAPQRLVDGVDVGVSYGFAAVAACFSYRLPGPWRWRWAVGLLLIAATALLVDRTFTDAGHLLALCVGLACYPLTKPLHVRLRVTQPIWSPPATSSTPTTSRC